MKKNRQVNLKCRWMVAFCRWIHLKAEDKGEIREERYWILDIRSLNLDQVMNCQLFILHYKLKSR